VGEAMASSYKSIFMGGPVAGGIHPPLKIFFPFYPENSLKSLNIAEKTKKSNFYIMAIVNSRYRKNIPNILEYIKVKIVKT
jgi:hypothetical protein